MKHNIERSVDTGDQELTVHMKNSPDATKIATSGDALKIWDANTGELLKTFKFALSLYLAWSIEKRSLLAAGQTTGKSRNPTTTPTYTVQPTTMRPRNYLPIGTPLHHCEDSVTYTTFFCESKFLHHWLR
jgi:hypothetical protein